MVLCEINSSSWKTISFSVADLSREQGLRLPETSLLKAHHSSASWELQASGDLCFNPTMPWENALQALSLFPGVSGPGVDTRGRALPFETAEAENGRKWRYILSLRQEGLPAPDHGYF